MCPPTATDAALVERLRTGDPVAFRDLYGQFSQATFGFLLRLAGRRDEAEDLHQEVWLSIARHATGLAPGTDLAAWIFTVARNRFRSSRRRPEARGARAASVPEERLAGAPPSEDPGCRDLERALAALPEVHREVLLLVAIEGLDTARAAAVLAIRPAAARQRLARARAALAQAVDAQASPAVSPALSSKRMSS